MTISPWLISIIMFTLSIVTSLISYSHFKKTRRIKNLMVFLVFSGGMMLTITFNEIFPQMIINKDTPSKYNESYERIFKPTILVSGTTSILLVLMELMIDKTNIYNFEKSDSKNDINRNKLTGKGLILFDTENKIIILVVILSLYSLLEGLGNISLSRFLALFIHKFVEAFYLGIFLGKTNLSRKMVYLLSFFDSLLPASGFLFVYIPNIDKVDWLLNGMAYGTISYMVFIEIIPLILKSKKILHIGIFYFGFLFPFLINHLSDSKN